MTDWLDIASAPHGEPVLLYCPDRGLTNPARVELGYASRGSRNEVSSSISMHAWATRWMPLPAPPGDTSPDDWRPIATAPQDGSVIEVLAPGREGLPPIQCLCAWHPDGGFCVDEVRVALWWRPAGPR